MHCTRRGLRSACLLILPYLATGCGPVWLLDPSAAERIAQKENKPLLLYFKAWDSSQDRNMHRHVFSDSAVSKELTGTVNAAIEFAFFPDYRNRYAVQRPQVCIMCAPDGRKVSTPLYVNPVPQPEKFLEWIQRAKQEAVPSDKPTALPPK